MIYNTNNLSHSGMGELRDRMNNQQKRDLALLLNEFIEMKAFKGTYLYNALSLKDKQQLKKDRKTLTRYHSKLINSKEGKNGKFTIEHLIPISWFTIRGKEKGKHNSPQNLALNSQKLNSKKGNRFCDAVPLEMIMKNIIYIRLKYWFKLKIK